MRSGPENGQKKKKYSGQQQKEIDCDEPHPAPNEKTQPIQWTERPTGALVAVNSLWPWPCIGPRLEKGYHQISEANLQPNVPTSNIY